MKTYELQILRYYHDIVTGEFVNVGIVLFSQEDRFLKCAVTHKYSRLSKFFHAEKTAAFVSQTIRSFEQSIQRMSEELKSLFYVDAFSGIEDITNQVLPKDDGSLQCSEVIRGLSLDLNKTFNELFVRYIAQYENTPQKTSRTDEDAWIQVYKKYFDEYGITRQLSRHEVKTENDTLAFDYAVQNGSLHLYNPVSFDLMEPESIKDKIYKWRGKISELETAKESITIHMLPLYPEHINRIDKESINKQLRLSANKDNLTIYDEAGLQEHLQGLSHYLTEKNGAESDRIF